MSKEEGEMVQEMKTLISIDMEQTIQEDWTRVESSKYCPYFKRLNTDIIMETCWIDKDKDEKKKHLWARARCVGTYGEDMREESDIHSGGVKWKKKGQNIIL